MEENKSKIGVTVSIIVIVLAVIAYGTYNYNQKSVVAVVSPIDNPVVTPTKETTPTPVEPAPVTTPIGTPVVIYAYKNGQYSATGSYYSPAGTEEIKVNLTIANDTVAAVSVAAMASDEESLKYQNRFIKNVSAVVVGKKISDLNLGKVSGSSLTPKGFNDALTKIKVLAKA